jgi:hypothetical protein
MKPFNTIQFGRDFGWLAMTAMLVIPPSVRAQQWQATVGAQSPDMGRQAMAFLPMRFGSTRAIASLGRSIRMRSTPCPS